MLRIKPKMYVINKLLALRGMSVSELARRTKISKQGLFQALRGDKVSAKTSKNVCQVLGVKFDDIFTLEEKK